MMPLLCRSCALTNLGRGSACLDRSRVNTIFLYLLTSQVTQISRSNLKKRRSFLEKRGRF